VTIALIGADGQLGSDLLRVLPAAAVAPLNFPEFDVTRSDRVRETLGGLAPDVVINTAAFHRVDECEARPHEAYRVNALAVRSLADYCRETGAVLVHFSSDYVFDGRKGTPYTEDDAPNPLNVYAVSKLAGEGFLRDSGAEYFLVRTCGLYGSAGPRNKGRNFVDAMVACAGRPGPVRVVADQTVTPTSTVELAVRVAALLGTRRFGLYHMTNEGACTWFEFAREIFRLLGRGPEIVPVMSEAYGAAARRPAYSVLDNRRMREAGLPDFSPWRKALRNYLREKGFLGPAEPAGEGR
jgi:dTDP-4-dehydrorhamnose reductase